MKKTITRIALILPMLACAVYAAPPSTGRYLWLKTDGGAGVDYVLSASDVARWVDKSGQPGYTAADDDLLSNTTTYAAIASSVLNGIDAIDFKTDTDIASLRRNNLVLATNQGLSLFAVIKPMHDGSARNFIFDVGDVSTYNYSVRFNTGNIEMLVPASGSSSGASLLVPDTDYRNMFSLFEFEYEFDTEPGGADGGYSRIRANGVLIGETNNLNQPFSGDYIKKPSTIVKGMSLGTRNKADNDAFHGYMLEILIYTNKITDAERAEIEAYFKGKYFPRITATSPTNNANIKVAGQAIDFTFDRAMDASSVGILNASTVVSNQSGTTFTATWTTGDNTTFTATLGGGSATSNDTIYIAITNVTNGLRGTDTAYFVGSTNFTYRAAIEVFSVSSITPLDGTTILPDTNVTVTFNNTMAANTVTRLTANAIVSNTNGAITGAWANPSSDSKTYVFTPTGTFTPGKNVFVVIPVNSVSNANGDLLGLATSATYTVTAFEISSVTPSDNAYISTTDPILVTFSLPMAANTASRLGFLASVSNTSGDVSGTWTNVTGSDTVYQFTPSVSYGYNETVYVTVPAGGVSNVYGDLLGAGVSVTYGTFGVDPGYLSLRVSQAGTVVADTGLNLVSSAGTEAVVGFAHRKMCIATTNTGSDELLFSFDGSFFQGHDVSSNVILFLDVAYYDNGNDSFSVMYASPWGQEYAHPKSIEKGNTKTWKMQRFILIRLCHLRRCVL